MFIGREPIKFASKNFYNSIVLKFGADILKNGNLVINSFQ